MWAQEHPKFPKGSKKFDRGEEKDQLSKLPYGTAPRAVHTKEQRCFFLFPLQSLFFLVCYNSGETSLSCGEEQPSSSERPGRGRGRRHTQGHRAVVPKRAPRVQPPPQYGNPTPR
ncbi:hypothetical protein ABVT39_006845 [Epinephelus coioides]